MRRRLPLALLVCTAILAFGCEDDVVVGEQCPGAYSGQATVELGDASLAETPLFGTSCAPCDGTGARLDEQGCPIYVTPESCGGPVCVGGAAFPGRGGDDVEDDGGVDDGEDGGDG